MTPTTVHKAITGAFGRFEPLCHVRSQSLLLRDDWDGVTCKNCLRSKHSESWDIFMTAVVESASIHSAFAEGDVEKARKLHSESQTLKHLNEREP